MPTEPGQTPAVGRRMRPAVAVSTKPVPPSTLHAEASSHATPLIKPPRAKVAPAEDADGRKPLRCSGCKSANPPDAFYCHWDGKPLFPELQPSLLPAGNLLFPSPFCFSNGQACANFNQLALHCNNLWEEARELVREGIWALFFTSMGRLDLAAAAKQAAQVPDPDLGLCQLLEKLPADPAFLRPPQLALADDEIDLQQLTPGTDYTFDLVLQNQGMLLLRGTVVSNFDWLVLGDRAKPLPVGRNRPAVRPAGPEECARTSEKMFQTRLGCAIPVRVLGSKLRAGLKPLLGEIIVDSNGGTAVVPVRAAVPVRPFPRGCVNDLLAGVQSPRELAAKAKQSPKEAGLLLEQGAVKTWYASNGWTYPVGGTEGMGTGAVQQFFEALGLTQPPKLEIKPDSLAVEGKPGETVLAQVMLRAQDAKPVYARAWSDQEWALPGPLKWLGSRVQVPVKVVVPADRGKTAEARVTIEGNAKQQFVVPVQVTIKKR